MDCPDSKTGGPTLESWSSSGQEYVCLDLQRVLKEFTVKARIENARVENALFRHLR